MGQSVFRTGLSKVGLPGAKEGMQPEDPTIATVLKAQGYATGQFGKNHLGDRDEHLPTMHGFDEFFGNLYHLNAEEEPENEDYPGDMVLADGQTFREKFGPRGVIHSWATADGKQRIEDTGPLTKKRMETVDDETTDRALEFIREQVTRRQALLRVVERHAHALPHPREGRAPRHLRPGRVLRRHGRARHAHRPVPGPAGRAGHRRQHRRLLLHRQRPPQQHLARRGEPRPSAARRTPTGRAAGACRPWCAGRARSRRAAGTTRSSTTWTGCPPSPPSRATTEVKDKLLKGVKLGDRKYKVHLDGYDMVPLLTGKTDTGPRHEIFYFSDDGDLTALRYDDWKLIFMEQRAPGTLRVWAEPFTPLRVPLMFNLRRDPYERAQITSNTYYDWLLDRAYLMVPAQAYVGGFLATFKDYPPRQKAASFSLEQVMEKLTPSGG